MRTLITLLSLLLTTNSQSQVARSFYFNGQIPLAAGTFCDQHPAETSYFTASTRAYDDYAETVVTKVDKFGQSLWHKLLPHAGSSTSGYSALNDLKATTSNIYISTYHCPSASLSEAKITWYKLSLEGDLLDSLTIDGSLAGVIAPLKAEISFDENGDLITAYQTSTGNVIFCRISSATLDIITTLNVGNSSLSNELASRSIFVKFDGINTLVAFNESGLLKLVKIDASSTIIASPSIPMTDGEMTDFEIHSGNYYMLINKHFSTSTATANPLRIVITNPSGSIISNNTIPVTNAQSFESFAIDNDGSIFIVSRGQSSTFAATGCIIKLSSAMALTYEHLLDRTHLNDIDIYYDQFITSGSQRNVTTNCAEQSFGNTLIARKKIADTNFQVVSPHMTIEFNNVSATIAYNSQNFNDAGSLSEQRYHINGAGATIYNSSLLIAGKDINDQLVSSSNISANFYTAGPFTDYAFYDELERDQWERVWLVSRAQIDAHIAAFISGDGTYQMPESIRHWPGNGDPSKGQAEQLAQYQDLNGNSIYEPHLGEYPLIKGDYCALSIYNDYNMPAICTTGSQHLGIEVHEYAYGFNCADDSSLQNTLFVYYMIFNRSTQTVYDTYMGHFIDNDINSANDDYISSDPLRSMFFGRNGNPAGEPEQAYVILAGHNDEDGIDNAVGIGLGEHPCGFGYGDAVADNERMGMTHFLYFNLSAAPNGIPESENDHYNYLQSIWKNGQHVLFGGDGFSVGTTPLESNFMFPDASDYLHYGTYGIDPSLDWSEENVGNPTGDRRGLASTGPFIMFPFDTIHLDIAFITGMENTTAGYTSHEALITNVDSARNYFNANETYCGQSFDFYTPFDGTYPSLGNDENELPTVYLYPNPTQGEFTLTGLSGNSTIRILNLSGQVVYNSYATTSTAPLSCNNLPAGIYFVEVSMVSGTQTFKLIKQ